MIQRTREPIKGWEGIYSVDNEGNVYSEERMVKTKGHGYRLSPFRMLKWNTKGRYPFVILRQLPRQKTALVHRLVAEAFVSNQMNKPEVNHVDGNKLNNHVSNLEWVTKSENKLHSTRVLGNGTGISHGMAKLSEQQVNDIRSERKKGTTFQKIANQYNISKQNVMDICQGKTWKHLLEKQ